jgi:hypothetical protein
VIDTIGDAQSERGLVKPRTGLQRGVGEDFVVSKEQVQNAEEMRALILKGNPLAIGVNSSVNLGREVYSVDANHMTVIFPGKDGNVLYVDPAARRVAVSIPIEQAIYLPVGMDATKPGGGASGQIWSVTRK